MTTQGDEIVRRARGWIGTPYLHQAATKGAGTDCLGLLRGLWREVAGHEPQEVPAYSADWSEATGREDLLYAAQRWLEPKAKEAMQPGDVLLFRMQDGAVAKHLGICARIGAEPSFIHAYQGHAVVESAFSAPWKRRLAACFAFPKGMF